MYDLIILLQMFLPFLIYLNIFNLQFYKIPYYCCLHKINTTQIDIYYIEIYPEN